jgi:hypothetical protein
MEENMTSKKKMLGHSGGGSSAVIAPERTVSTENLAPTEGILYAIVDHGLLALNNSFGNLIGHYSRPDLFMLAVDDRAKTHVVYHQDKEHPQMNGLEKV